ncbi:MAG: hypothetical protein E7333_07450 [Clostridiales bacterium]|nr:hypothetical protein [Clostridiales bacterium]
MKKSKLFLILALVLSLAVGLGGTLAYLTDTDEDVNVMTLGNVQIEQIELQRAEGVDYRNGGEPLNLGDLVPFQQGKALYPAYAASDDAYTAVQDNDEQLWWSLNYVNNGTTKGGSNGLWNDYNLKGAMDKFVFVKNTGSSDAYFRTWIALECPEGMEYGEDSDKEFMNNVNGSVTAYKWDSIGYAEIDGVRYCILAATYQKVLEPGKTSHPSLLQVVMTHNATNEDMKLLGNTYEILTFTQAVQTNNFENAEQALDTAFGDITADNHPWTNATIEIPTFVKTADELVAAFANIQKDDVIHLANDIDMTGKTLDATNGNVGFTLYGNGHTISNLVGTEQGLFVNNTGSSDYYFYDVHLENCKVDSATNYAGLFVGDADTCDELVFENCTAKDCTVKSAKYAAAFAAYTAGYDVQNNGPVYGDVTIKDCEVIGGSITGNGSVGAAIGHSGGNPDTTNTITNLKVEGVAIKGEDAEHTGIVVGTANVGKTIINNATYENVTGNYNTKHPLYGRFVPDGTGTLTIDGTNVTLAPTDPWETIEVSEGNVTRENQAATDYVEICHKSGNLTLKNVVFENGLTIYTNKVDNNGTITLEDCVIYLSNGTAANSNYNQCKADYGLNLNLANGSDITLTFKNCKFLKPVDHTYSNSPGSTYNVYIGGGYSANSITFEGCTFEGSAKHAIGCSSEATSKYYKLTVTGCNFKDWNNNAENGAAIRGNLPSADFAADITISGNTFGNSNNSTQTTVAIDSWNGTWN